MKSTYTILTSILGPGVQVTVPSDELERLDDLGFLSSIISANVSTDEVLVTDGQEPVSVPIGQVWYNRAAV